MQAWLAQRPALSAVLSILYVWGHLPATVGALVWTRLQHPRAFGLARDAFLATQGLVVAGYLAVPTAPPRMLSGPVDGGWVDRIQSPYAALPSGHVAFACVVAGIVCSLAPWRWVRATLATYPLLVTAIVIATANHFWLDAVAGAGAAASGFTLAVIARTWPGVAANRRSRGARIRDEHVSPDSPAPRRRPHSASSS